MNDELKTVALVQRSAFRVHCSISGGDDRIRTCEGLLTLNGLANRRLQPLGHISAQSENHSNRRPRIVKVGEDMASRYKTSSHKRSVHLDFLEVGKEGMPPLLVAQEVHRTTRASEQPEVAE